jgi:hypothetical protein
VDRAPLLALAVAGGGRRFPLIGEHVLDALVWFVLENPLLVGVALGILAAVSSLAFFTWVALYVMGLP